MNLRIMVQQFLGSFRLFWSKSDKYIVIAMLSGLGIFLKLLIKFHFTDLSSLNQLLGNLIQFSGIFSAILITYIISKVFQNRQERLERGKEVIKIANKVTDLRRIARILLNCNNFWNSEMKRKIDSTYKDLTFFDVYYWDYEVEHKYSEIGELRSKYFEEEHILGADLYLAMKSFANSDFLGGEIELFSRYDYDYTYTLDILDKWTGSHAANRLYYCFKHKWGAYRDCFDFESIRTDSKDEILELVKKIDPSKFSNAKFSKDLLADVGTDMEEFYLPRLQLNSYYNSLPLSPTLNFILTILFLTIISGVFIPLILSSIAVQLKVLIWASSISVTLLFLSLFYFVLKFKKILNSEIEM